MKVALEGFEFGADAGVEVVVEDGRGHVLRISAHEALELMELLASNAGCKLAHNIGYTYLH